MDKHCERSDKGYDFGYCHEPKQSVKSEPNREQKHKSYAANNFSEH